MMEELQKHIVTITITTTTVAAAVQRSSKGLEV